MRYRSMPRVGCCDLTRVLPAIARHIVPSRSGTLRNRSLPGQPNAVGIRATRDAKIRTGASDRSKETGIVPFARPQEFSRSSHQLDWRLVVESQAVLAHQPSRGEAMQLGRAVESPAGHAALCDA